MALRVVALLLLGLLLAVANPAQAGDFETLAAKGIKAYEEGNYDVAIENFFAAKLLRDEPDLLYNIARAYDKKGDCAAAKKYYEQIMSRPDAASDTLVKARRYLDELGGCARSGELALSCFPERALVRINQNPLGPCGKYTLDAGDYQLEVSAEGYVSQQRSLTIVANQSNAVTLHLEIAERVVDDPETGVNWVALGFTGGGVALLGAALLVDGLNYANNASELDKLVLGDPRRAPYEESYSTHRQWMFGLGIAGTTFLLSGIVLWALDIPESSSQSWQLGPQLADDGYGATLRVAF